MRKLLLFAATFFFIFTADAQSLSPQVIASGGGYLTGSNGSVRFTIGEAAVGSFHSATGGLTQGFQPDIGASNPLPLDFLSFTANMLSGKTFLQWVTTQEVNTDYFEAQRSNDGAHFIKIAYAPAKDPNDPGAVTTYQAVDSLPLPGTDYYRIKEVDQGGQVTYSPIVAVKISEGLSCMVYPNPVVDELNVRVNSSNAAQATIALYDLSGRLISARLVQLVPGQNQFSLYLADKAKGIYIVRILGLETLPSFSILKE
jgi:hypothetical protein